jgi:hypothetical protein
MEWENDAAAILGPGARDRPSAGVQIDLAGGDVGDLQLARGGHHQ